MCLGTICGVGVRLWPANGTCVVSWAPRLPHAVSGSGVRCGRVSWARVSAVPSHSWLGCWGVFFALLIFLFFPFFLFCVSVPGLVVPFPPIPFLSGWAGGCIFFSFCFGVPFPGGPLFLAWCCRFWVGGPPVPLWGSCLRCLLGGGLAASGGARGRFGGCGLFSRLFPLPPLFFFLGGGGLLVPPPAFPGLVHTLACIQSCLPGCCFQLLSVWPRSAPWVGWPMYTVGSAPLLAGLGPGSAGWAAAPGGCVWLWVRGLGLFVSFPLCSAGFNLLGGSPPLLPGALVCGVLVRHLPGCAVAGFG